MESLGFIDEFTRRRLVDDHKRLTAGRNRGRPTEFWEPMTINGKNRAFRAFRFLFEAKVGDRKVEFLGDISFDWTAMEIGQENPVQDSLGEQTLHGLFPDQMEAIFPAFLEKCPTAIAIKRLNGEIAWCNPTYLSLLHEPDRRLDRAIGKTAKQLFKLDASSPIVQNDFLVGQQNVWMYAIETLPNKEPRTSLRFPIIGKSGPMFVGVASADFQLKNVSQMAFVRQGHDRATDDGRARKSKTSALRPLK
ncbi:MAG: hypothetical protein FJW26_21290 [Acidimicrobiia bacterium]|nr:hypothetical protein [Acidimicrobiia bacterium]